MKSPERPLAIGSIAMITAVFVDQVTKALVVANADVLSSGLPVFPGFNFVFGRNDGVSFGMLGGLPWWSLSTLAIFICAWLAVLLIRTHSRIEALALGAIIGGAMGNVIDRLRFRAVTDFLDFYIGSMHWPAFNMADVFVVCGVALLLAAPLLGRKI